MGLKDFLVENVVMPPKVFASPLLNRMGLQPTRILVREALNKLRRRAGAPEVRAAVRKLDSDGFVVIPSFLPAADFAALRAEFEAAFAGSNPDLRLRKTGPNMIGEIDVLATAQQGYARARRLVMQSAFLRAVVERAAGRKLRIPPACILQVLSLDAGTRSANTILHHSDEFDVETVFHQDHCLPIFKAWFYVDDVEEANGAFVYAPGTHRVTMSRLRYEYRKSVYYHLLQEGSTDRVPLANLQSGRYVPSTEEKAQLGFREVSLGAPANSLVIVNTVGFHRRGDLSPGRERGAIHVDFRRLHSPLNLVPLIDRIPALERAILRNRRRETYLA
jgi:Phytanoyl-CoA dioxygenase (PhyH)